MFAFYISLNVIVSDTHSMRRTGNFFQICTHFVCLFVSHQGINSQKAYLCHTFGVYFTPKYSMHIYIYIYIKLFGGKQDQGIYNMLGFLLSQRVFLLSFFTLFLYIILTE